MCSYGSSYFPCLVFLYFGDGPQPDVVIGVGQQGWWLRRDTTKQITQWRVGSIRRREFVCLVWGFWPWQLIRIRPDSLPDTESSGD